MDLPDYIKAGSISKVKDYIESKRDLNVYGRQSHPYLPPISLALYYDQTCIALLLIKAGSNVNLRDCYGASAAHIACKKGNAKVLRALVQAKVDLKAKTVKYRTRKHCLDYHSTSMCCPRSVSKWNPITPAEVAYISGHKHLAPIFVEAGLIQMNYDSRYFDVSHWILDETRKLSKISPQELYQMLTHLQRNIGVYYMHDDCDWCEMYHSFVMCGENFTHFQIDDDIVMEMMNSNVSIVDISWLYSDEWRKIYLKDCLKHWPSAIVNILNEFVSGYDWKEHCECGCDWFNQGIYGRQGCLCQSIY